MPTLASPLACPACGAPVPLLSAAPYAVCSHCQSLLVRRDASAETVGKVAEVPEDFSPFQVGTGGSYEGRRFVLVGRLRKSWDQGSWNEWCAAFDDARFGWLAEAQGDLVMTFALPPVGPQPDTALARRLLALAPGDTWPIAGKEFTVTDIKEVACSAAQGELARGVARGAMTSIDLRGPQAAFATWEIAGDAAQLFVGRYVTFEECAFRQLRALEGWGPPPR